VVRVKAVIVIGDGMADRQLKELNHLTPLEIAEPKNMDRVASLGVSGLLYALSPGVAPGSDVATLAILGYDPYKVYTGRGGLEAVGAGIELRDGDVAFRCDFATVNEDLVVIDERAGRVREGIPELAAQIRDLRLKLASDVEIMFKQTLGFKGVLVLRGEGLSPNVSAHKPKLGLRADFIRPLDDSKEAKRTADILNEFIRASYSVLNDHPVNQERRFRGKPPANVLIPWGSGTRPNLAPLQERYGLRGACVAAVSLIKGICRLSGMDVIDVLGATGEIDTDTMAKASAALEALKDHDLVLVHVEGSDEASHDGDLLGKVSIIKKIDLMVGAILEKVDLEETCIVLLADHATPVKLKKHVADPTPITIAGLDMVRDGVSNYNERTAYRGGLGCIRGRHVMPILLNLLGRPMRFGA
jgi:2,3-bisphosphoglycerate-independent phosphoglycerate mutase